MNTMKMKANGTIGMVVRTMALEAILFVGSFIKAEIISMIIGYFVGLVFGLMGFSHEECVGLYLSVFNETTFYALMALIFIIVNIILLVNKMKNR